MAAPKPSPNELLDQLIRTLQEKVDGLNAAINTATMVKENLSRFPAEFVDGLVQAMTAAAAKSAPPPAPYPDDMDDEDDSVLAQRAGPIAFSKSGTNFQRMVEFFHARNNHPATNHDIRTALNLSRGSVAVVLYNTHPDHFERLDDRVPNKVAWRLSAAKYPEHNDAEIPF
jgi:hypothetical protein